MPRPTELLFQTMDHTSVPALTADQMAEVDRIATEDFKLTLLQMMENAGHALARTAANLLPRDSCRILILAGAGENGGGGICAARHLSNWGWSVELALSRPPGKLGSAAAHQLNILTCSDFQILVPDSHHDAIRQADLIVDALIGYSLHGPPTGHTAALIQSVLNHRTRTLSLDVPSGIHATSGHSPGICIQPEQVLTLALPKCGLHGLKTSLLLADIGLPASVFTRIGIHVPPIFRNKSVIRISAIA